MHADEKLGLLIVEDDATIRYLEEVAAQRTGVFDPISAAADGRAALEWLKSRAPHELPAIVVTDLNMPRMNGLDLLRAIKTDPALERLCVAVITSSNIPHDREDALAAGACAFIPKPMRLEEFSRAMAQLRHAWESAAV